MNKINLTKKLIQNLFIKDSLKKELFKVLEKLNGIMVRNIKVSLKKVIFMVREFSLCKMVKNLMDNIIRERNTVLES